MSSDACSDKPPTIDSADDALRALQARTPARLVVGRAGMAYRTATQLDLREDHAIAVDAVRAELDLARDFDPQFIATHELFEVTTPAGDKSRYLQRPELGRQLCPQGEAEVRQNCPSGADLQVVIGDGLSAAAVVAQVPELLPRLKQGAHERGWSYGRPFVIRYCRVGVLNHVGAITDAQVVVLLIGERPGLATAVSLSAYMAYRPRAGHTDAQRNLISNIHERGVNPAAAAERILALAAQLMHARSSGVTLKERLPGAALPSAEARNLNAR